MIDILLAVAVMGPWSMSGDYVHVHYVPMYRPQYHIVTPWEVYGALVLDARRRRAAWLECRRETAGKARAAQQQRRYGTYLRLAERQRKTPAEIQGIAQAIHARKARARARADRARAQGYGHARGE